MQSTTFFTTKTSCAVIAVVIVIFSLWSPFFSFSRTGIVNTLIGTPKYWFDEASTVDAARSLVELGKLDIAVEPGKVTGKPLYANSPGFTVQFPLAILFKYFGVGVLQMRIYALLWLFATAAAIYCVWREIFDAETAWWGTLLIVTFTSFYANGRTIVGTLPGLFFLLLALYHIYGRQSYVWGGVLAGLALVTKPSMFLLIVPVFLIEFLISEHPHFFKKSFQVIGGALPILAVWLLIIFPHPFSLQSWKDAFTVYGNHYSDPSLYSTFSHTWKSFFSNTTVIYFLLLSTLVIGVLARFPEYDTAKRRVSNFILLYVPFALIYFFTSPGWFRYLVVFQVFMLLLVYPSLKKLFEGYSSIVVRSMVGGLVRLQIVTFFHFSEIHSGIEIPQLADSLNARLEAHPQATIGIINAEELGALLPTTRKYQIVFCGGSCVFGTHPLSVLQSSLPDYVVVNQRQTDKIAPYEQVLQENYTDTPEIMSGFLIYKKKK